MTIFVNRNENAPTFTRDLYQRTVLENSGLGSSLLMVEATDDDQVHWYFCDETAPMNSLTIQLNEIQLFGYRIEN